MTRQTFYESTLHTDLIGKTTTDGIRIGDLWAEVNHLIEITRERRLVVEQWMGYHTTKPDADKVSQSKAFWMRRAEHTRSVGKTVIDYDIAVTTAMESFAAGYGWTKEAELLVLTAAEIRQRIAAIIEGDEFGRYYSLLRQFFSNAPRDVVDELTRLSVTVYPFYYGAAYGGDTEVPPPQGMTTFSANHNHFLRSAVQGVITEADLDALTGTVREHGFTTDVFLICNEDMGDQIMSLSAVTPYYGLSKYVSDDAVAINKDSSLVQISLGLNSLFRIIGVFKGKAQVAISNQLPAGYIGCFSHQGDSAVNNPLQIREPLQPNLRGLQIERESVYPFVNTEFFRFYAVGVRQRGNGACMQVTGWVGGAYVEPTWPSYNNPGPA